LLPSQQKSQRKKRGKSETVREEREEEIEEEMEKRAIISRIELEKASERENRIMQKVIDRVKDVYKAVPSSLAISDTRPKVRGEEIIDTSDISKRQRDTGMLSTIGSNFETPDIGRKRFVGESFGVDSEETETEDEKENVYEATDKPNVFSLVPRDLKKSKSVEAVGGTKAQTRISKKQLEQTPVSFETSKGQPVRVLELHDITPSATIPQLDLSHFPFSPKPPSSTPPSSTRSKINIKPVTKKPVTKLEPPKPKPKPKFVKSKEGALLGSKSTKSKTPPTNLNDLKDSDDS
jgi:hypothetical protein